MFNPRFPHSLVVKRPRFVNGDIYTNVNGDIIYDTVPLTCVEMFDNEPVRDVDGNFVTFEKDSIEFGYRTSSRSSRTEGDVIVADFRIACPMFLTEIKTDDILELTDYDRTYRGTVIKKTTFNLGTNIWFDEIKN